MQYAMNSLVGNSDNTLTDFPGSNYKTTAEGGAVVTLLNNITAGVGFRIGKVNNCTETYTYNGKKGLGADTAVTLNLAGYTYTFATPVTGESISKRKGIQISEKDATCSTNVTIKDGVLNIADQTTDGVQFERLIRSYTDLTIENVTLDGRNVKGQESGENGAVVCHSIGTLNLKGNTSIIIQNDTADKTYYALSGRAYGGYTDDSFTINVNTTGKDRDGNDTAIKNIGLYTTWVTVINEAAHFKTEQLNLKSGNVGEVTLSKKAVDELGVALSDVFSITSATGDTLNIGSFDYDSTGANVLYQKSADSLYTLAQVNSWNAASTADSNTTYNYVVADTDTSNKGGGKVALNVTGVTDKDALTVDNNNKIFGVPTGATAAGAATDYKFAYLTYNKNKDAVTVSSATENAELYAGNYTLNAGTSNSVTGSGVIAGTAKKIDASENSVENWLSRHLDKIISSSSFLQELSNMVNEKLADFSNRFLDLFGKKKTPHIKKIRRSDVVHHEDMKWSKRSAEDEKIATVENISVGGENISAKIIKLDDAPEENDKPLVEWDDITNIDDKKFLDGFKFGIGLAFLSMALNGLTDHLLFNIPSAMLMWMLGALGAAIHLMPEEDINSSKGRRHI